MSTIEMPSVTVTGVTVEHNQYPWQVKTNRHSNTDGSSWGWIESAPGNVCWSNNETFDFAAACKMAATHNKWLEDQQPLTIKIIKANKSWRAAKDARDKIKSAYDEAEKAFRAAEDEFLSLMRQYQETGHEDQEPAQ